MVSVLNRTESVATTCVFGLMLFAMTVGYIIGQLLGTGENVSGVACPSGQVFVLI